MNYREFEDGVIICDLFNCVCNGNKDCNNCDLLNEYINYYNNIQ